MINIFRFFAKVSATVSISASILSSPLVAAEVSRIPAPDGVVGWSFPPRTHHGRVKVPYVPPRPVQMFANTKPPPSTGGSWTTVTPLSSTSVTPAPGTNASVTPAPMGLCNPLLLTDATVMVQGCESGTWYKLTPSATGDYATGAWAQLSQMPAGYGPLYAASAVLPDGRVIVEGGEYNLGKSAETNLGAIYDPQTDTWASVAPPIGWPNIGDAPSIVLPNGLFMLGGPNNQNAILDPNSLTWAATAAPCSQGEQGYTLKQNDEVLTIDVGFFCPEETQVYNQGTGTWTLSSALPLPLNDFCSSEIGPAVTRNDGTVVAFGGQTGCGGVPPPPDPTAIYYPPSFSSGYLGWYQGINVPAVCGYAENLACSLADAPAALLPNGNILFAASAGFQTSNAQGATHFFEFTTDNTIVQVADPNFIAIDYPSFAYNFLVLPNGQVFVTDQTVRAQIYTPVAGYNFAYAPSITFTPVNLVAGGTYSLSGTQLHGLSQGAAYGDDNQSATNYPIVSITNINSGHVAFAQTFNHSTMSIAPNLASNTSIVVPVGIEQGRSWLQVIANGVASVPVVVNVQRSLHTKKVHFFSGGTADILWRNTLDGEIGIWHMNAGSEIGDIIVYTLSQDWQIVGTGDFNRDGTTDILWHSKLDGSIQIWYMNSDGTFQSNSPVLPSENFDYAVAGTGDFDGDGVCDILWRGVDGSVVIWLMNPNGTIKQNTALSATSDWTIVGLGDFAKRGYVDILWRHTGGTDGALVMWQMTGANITNSITVKATTDTNWTVEGTGDFDGDGYTDILWRYVDGTTAVWLMNGSQVKSYSGNFYGTNDYAVVDTGDYNGDGKADILWRKTDGTLSMWLMNGLNYVSVPVNTVPAPNWSIVQ